MLTFQKDCVPKLKFKKAMKKPIAIRCIQIEESFSVETMEGIMKGKKGDWLLIGVNDEMYPCDKAIFKKTYDLLK